jgi:hypothetical protein
MNDMHDYPDEYKGSGVLVEAALPDGRRVPADVMHLLPNDQVRYLLWQNSNDHGGKEPPPYRIDLQFCGLYEGTAP